MGSTSHIERTAAQPRAIEFHEVQISNIAIVNERIKIFRLSIHSESPSIKFLPGQWLDVYVPGINQPGGFSITSTPAAMEPDTLQTQIDTNEDKRFIELAVQTSPSNVVALWLWQPVNDVLGQILTVRVGGSFVWPPPNIVLEPIRRVVFVAGGVGIGPLMSIVEHLSQIKVLPFEITLFYSVRDPGGQRDTSRILYIDRLTAIFKNKPIGKLMIYLTPNADDANRHYANDSWEGKMDYSGRRIEDCDVLKEIGPVDERQYTICYICGVPTMTDGLIAALQNAEGMNPAHVIFERWW